MTEKVVFHLKRYAPLTPVRPYLHCAEILYEQIRSGEKTSEWRNPSKYWLKRLVTKVDLQVNATSPQNLTSFLKVHKAWFMEGYPKRNLPRLEADITALIYHPFSQQLEIKIANIKETK